MERTIVSLVFIFGTLVVLILFWVGINQEVLLPAPIVSLSVASTTVACASCEIATSSVGTFEGTINPALPREVAAYDLSGSFEGAKSPQTDTFHLPFSQAIT